MADYDQELIDALQEFSPEEIEAVIDDLPLAVVNALGKITPPQSEESLQVPRGPIEQAIENDPKYAVRPHLTYLSERLRQAVEDVENGKNRFVLISMPPRAGKSRMTSIDFPTWLMRKHPDWKLGMISHSDMLAVSFGREVRRTIEENQDKYRIKIARDAGAAAHWQTTKGGSVTARSAPGQSLTGLGFKVMMLDDAVKDFAAAHSKHARDTLWDWWLANAYTRMEPPYLVVAIGTRWHEDDILGRFLSPEYEGDPDQWEVIKFPAIAEEDDVLGRKPGEPLYSPLVDETQDEALERWDSIKKAVGSYTWAALYQQRPAPTEGAIFNVNSWRFWTDNPDHVSKDDDSVVLLTKDVLNGKWVDSWDAAFKGNEASDYVVGQRWVRHRGNRYLIAQKRARMTFTQTLEAMRAWARTDNKAVSPYGDRVHERLIEDKANGPAIIDSLKAEISGIRPVKAINSKEARARAITPEVESGNVYLPHPAMPGYEWVTGLIDEARDFPHGANDDQVDAMTQALNHLRQAGATSIGMPRGTIDRTSRDIRPKYSRALSNPLTSRTISRY